MKVTFIRRIDGYIGDARLYRDEEGKFLVVSAVVAPFSGPETYIFSATEEGGATDFTELEGSFRGGLDHRQALRNAGYVSIIEDAS